MREKGRVVYIGGELDKEMENTDNYAAYHVLANAVQWAGKRPWMIQTDAPPTVEVAAYKSEAPAAITLYLRNQNITRDFVLPLNDINVRISHLPFQPVDVSTVSGNSVNHRLEGQALSLTLPKLNEYEVIIIKGK